VVSGSTLTLIKGALKVMAWTKVKTAVVVGVGILIAVKTVDFTVKEIKWHGPFAWQVLPSNSDELFTVLHYASAQVKILPTKFPQFAGEMVSSDDQTLGIGMTIESLIEFAYGKTDFNTMISTELPQGKYDFIANLSHGSREALREEIIKQFGIVGRFEMRPSPAGQYVLKTNDQSALKITPRKSYAEKAGMWFEKNTFRWSGQPTSQLTTWLERAFKTPIVDQTGVKNLGNYSFNLDWSEQDLKNHNFGKLKQALKEVGFELISTNMPIEMLVVEKVK
jgi:uncharacterized protein (TIGR03435 family)